MENDQPPTPDDGARVLASLMSRFQEAGWMSGYQLFASDTLEIEFTESGKTRMKQLYEAFQQELGRPESPLSVREYLVLTKLLAHYGPKLPDIPR